MSSAENFPVFGVGIVLTTLVIAATSCQTRSTSQIIPDGKSVVASDKKSSPSAYSDYYEGAYTDVENTPMDFSEPRPLLAVASPAASSVEPEVKALPEVKVKPVAKKMAAQKDSKKVPGPEVEIARSEAIQNQALVEVKPIKKSSKNFPMPTFNKKAEPEVMKDEIPVAVAPDNGEKKTIEVEVDSIIRIVEADGNDVKISGTQGVVVVKGRCGKLNISGNGNRVRCDFADEITINGNGNIVTAETLENGSISGFQNDLSWKKNPDSGVPVVKETGGNNRSGILY